MMTDHRSAAAFTAALATALLAVPLASPAAAQKPDANEIARTITSEIEAGLAAQVQHRDTAEAQAQAAREITREVRDAVREVTREVQQAARQVDRQTVRERRGPEQTERVTKAFKVGKAGALDLSNFVGSVTITGGAGEEIAIDAVKRVRAATPEEGKKLLGGLTIGMTERAGRVEVRTSFASRETRGAVDYTVTIPSGGSVFLRSMAGDIKVTNVKGEIHLDATSGNIVVSGAGPLLRVKTMAGDIQVSDMSGDGELAITTMSGEVTAQKIRAKNIDVTGVSGGLTFTDITCDRVRLHTTAGDVAYAGPLAKNGRYELRSHSGDVTLTPASTTGFEVEASTFSGTFKSDFPVTLRTLGPSETTAGTPPPPPPPPPAPPTPPNPPRRGDRAGRPGGPRPPEPVNMRNIPGSAVQGTYGDGSAVLVLASFSGDITIVKK